VPRPVTGRVDFNGLEQTAAATMATDDPEQYPVEPLAGATLTQDQDNDEYIATGD